MSRARRPDHRVWGMLVAGGAALGAWLLLTLWIGSATLEGDAAQAHRAWLLDHWAVWLLMWAVGVGALAWVLQLWFRYWVLPAAQLVEHAQVFLRTDVVREMPPSGNRETRALTAFINQMVNHREQMRLDMDAKVREAAQGIEQEKSRLAALMSELTQSVVVCNLDGRILLYNNRARMQFRALSDAPRLADGAELIGLGRSIYTVFDRKLVAHALESVQQRLKRGAANPSAQFVTTTRAGQLLRVQMAPVRQVSETESDASALAGFVLMLDNITRDFEQEAARDRLLVGLTEGSRSSLANIQAAVEMLDYPDLEPAMRDRFLGVVREEVRAMTDRLQQLMHESADGLKTRWPMEDMLGADLITAVSQRVRDQAGLPVEPAEVDSSLWLRVESFSLIQALVYLSARLKDEFEIRFVQLRLQAGGASSQASQKAQLDLVWSGQAMSAETVMSWELDNMRVGQDVSALTVRDVVERHGGAFWFERDRSSHQAYFRFLLPTAVPQEQMDTSSFVRNESRPEYYDFDLFRTSATAQAMEDVPLTALAYTVFDTETTGLNPSQGDEIIQIGATRIVNGKLLRQESFEQLVHPGRPIPAASIPIHGITPEMVEGQPSILEVLPAFHAFSQDTVLVAHNAAFDMRFLQLKEKATGLRFDHPVLDTLLLSALVHPNQDSHRLEAIAERFGVTVIGRHTAMGDAMVTAEVFLKLIPLLAEKGIHTLGQARAAAERTYYARLKY